MPSVEMAVTCRLAPSGIVATPLPIVWLGESLPSRLILAVASIATAASVLPSLIVRPCGTDGNWNLSDDEALGVAEFVDGADCELDAGVEDCLVSFEEEALELVFLLDFSSAFFSIAFLPFLSNNPSFAFSNSAWRFS